MRRKLALGKRESIRAREDDATVTERNVPRGRKKANYQRTLYRVDPDLLSPNTHHVSSTFRLRLSLSTHF